MIPCVAGSVAFSVFISNLDDLTECTLKKFTDDSKLGVVLSNLGDKASI